MSRTTTLYTTHSDEQARPLSGQALPRIRRLLLSVMMAVCLAAGVGAATARPAEAASYVSGCFRNSKAGMNVQSLPVQLQAYSNGSWYTIASDTLGLSGCTAWNIGTVHRGYYLRMLVNYRASGAWWFGSSPLYANPGNLAADIGTGVVTCYGCPY